jgi:hypothetical protein
MGLVFPPGIGLLVLAARTADVGIAVFNAVVRSAPIALTYGVPNRCPPDLLLSCPALDAIVKSKFNQNGKDDKPPYKKVSTVHGFQ